MLSTRFVSWLPSTYLTWLVTRPVCSISKVLLFAYLWNTQMVETSNPSSSSFEKTKHVLTVSNKSMFGRSPMRSSKASKCSTIIRSFIEISKAQTYFLSMIGPNWVTWMFRRWPSKEWLRLKLERHTTLVRKYGWARNIATNAIYGHSECCCMRCAAWECHLLEEISPLFTKESSKGSMRSYRNTILSLCKIWWECVW